MTWTEAQLAEALDYIRVINESQIAMRRDLAEMRASLVWMREAFDRMSALIGSQLFEVEAPSICPTLAPSQESKR